MKVRRVAVPMLIVLAAVAAVGWQCPPCREKPPIPSPGIPGATQYVVIVPPEPGMTQCRVIPDPRVVEKTRSLTFINLSDVQAKIELPAALTASSSPTPAFFLSKDESKVVLVDAAKSGEYIYSVEGPLGGCLTGLPTPRIVIP